MDSPERRVFKEWCSNDTPDSVEAAALLRNGLQQFFVDTSEALEAKVTYRSNGLYTLGDYLPAAQSRILKLLDRESKAEEKVGNKDNVLLIH